MFKSQVIDIQEYEKGLLYKQGKFQKLLDGGRYVIRPWQALQIAKIDVREASKNLSEQEILSKDKKKIYVVLVVRYKINDPVAALHNVEDYNKRLREDLKLTLQENIARRNIEDILENVDTLPKQLLEETTIKTKPYGISLTHIRVEKLSWPGTDSKTVNIWEHEKGILYREGRFEKILGSGRYTLNSWQPTHITKVSIREVTKTLQGEEVPSLDKIAMRIALSIKYKVVDPVAAIHNVENYDAKLCQDLHFALKENILKRMAQDIVENRSALAKQILQDVIPNAKEYGIALNEVYIENIVSPAMVQHIVDIQEYEKGLLYKEGQFDKLLDSGHYIVKHWEHLHITKVDIRETSQTIQGQEILTKDKIGVRITLVAQFKVSDPVAAIHNVESYHTQLYQDLQLTLRENITGRTIEEVLEDREALSKQLLEEVALRAQAYGVTLSRVGVKDVILPGVVRSVFLQEVEADRKGRAERISARYAIAVARSKANTAKILKENPNIMRLKELETLTELASKEGNVIIIPGLNNLFHQKAIENGAK